MKKVKGAGEVLMEGARARGGSAMASWAWA